MRKVVTKIIPAVIGGAAGKAGVGKGLIGAGIGLVAARIAKRSVPGAILVGGAMVAKWLYDQKKAEDAEAEVAAVAATLAAPSAPLPDAPAKPRAKRRPANP